MGLGRVARMYYELEMTQREISETLGVSRVSVTRMLAEARDTGIVKVIIDSQEPFFRELEEKLVSTFGLGRVWVSPSLKDPEKSADAFARVGAEAISAVVERAPLIALGVSSAVASAINAYRPEDATGNTFVSAAGSVAGPLKGWNPHELAFHLASKVDGRAFQVPAPVVAQTPETALYSLEDSAVREVLAMAATADASIMGIGGMSSASGLLVQSFSDGERRELLASEAVGDLSGRFFNAQGAPVSSSVGARVIALSYDELHAIPRRLIIARGDAKVAPLLGALAGGLLTDLATDNHTAQALLDARSDRPSEK